jgi:hypothetical protein
LRAAEAGYRTKVQVALDDIIGDNFRVVQTISNICVLFRRGYSNISPIDFPEVLREVVHDRILDTPGALPDTSEMQPAQR